MKYPILTLLLFAGIMTPLSAQTFIQDDTETTTVETLHADHADFVYLDTDEKICFVDLEKVNVNLKQAVLINAAGDEVISKQLQGLPVNSIVELDYSKLPSGAYVLELRSYRGTTHQALRL